MTHILIINQHGENRGDEAAMRAMLARFKEELGDVRFTLLYQFRDRNLRLSFVEDVEALPIIAPPIDYLRLGLFSAAKIARWEPNGVLSPTMRKIINAYRTADLVVSAPGGPYFGDIYVNHEIFHWWYVWLAARFGKPLFLYAPSAGPFRNAAMNALRRRGYRKFDVLVTREELSRDHLLELLGPETQIHVTADSAIQQSFPPLARDDYFVGERSALKEKFLVAVSLNDYGYPGAANRDELRARYDAAMIALLHHLAQRKDCHFIFLPQLYGAVHSDVPYLQRMAQKLNPDISWEIVDQNADSHRQRRIFAMCDLHLASRYHPAIFGNTAFVPGLCLYYEHKALGFMTQLGLERFAFDIRAVDIDALRRAADELLEQRDQLVAHLRERVPELTQRARRTTDLAIELLERTRS